MGDHQSPRSETGTPRESNISFALPPELRTKILKCLLIAKPELYFKSFIPDKSAHQRVNSTLNNSALATQFHILCSVSKQTRAEAREIFFTKNKSFIEVVLRTGPEKTLYTHLNTLDLITRNWGYDVLSRFKDVFLHLEFNRKDEEAGREIKTQLERLVFHSRGWKMQKLRIGWDDSKTSHGTESHPKQVYRRCARLRSAHRERIPKYLERHGLFEMWHRAQHERILDPLR